MTVYCFTVCRTFSIATIDLQVCLKQMDDSGTCLFTIANNALVKRLFLS